METPDILTSGNKKSKSSKRTITSSTNHFSKPLAPKAKDIPRVNKRERVINILNSRGEDVTPINLGFTKKNADGSLSSVDVSTAAGSITDILNQLENLTGGSNSSVSSSTSANKSTFNSSKMMLSINKNQSFREDYNTSTSQYGMDRSANSSMAVTSKDISTAPALVGITPNIKPKVTNPDKIISIDLKETDINFMLSIPSIVVSSENVDETAMVKAQNAKYKELLALNRNNDNYISKHAQTYTTPIKNKEISTNANKKVDCEVNTDSWDIYDSYVVEEEEELTEGQKASELEAKISSTQEVMSSATDIGKGTAHGSRSNSERSSSVIGSNSVIGSKSFVRSSIAPSSNGSVGGGNLLGASSNTVSKDKAVVPKPEDLMKKINQESLLNTLALMERAIVANNFKKNTIAYRNVRDSGAEEQKRVQQLHRRSQYDDLDIFSKSSLPEVSRDEHSPSVSQLKFLWVFKCDLTRGRSVSCFSWNKENEDILAVGYGGSKDLPNASPGIILVWSARNPEWPDRIYTLSNAVTAVDFSKSNPSLLAAGISDGRIVVFDIRQKKDKIILDSGDGEGKHRDSVWEVKWVERERVIGDEQSRDEYLVSVSTDGRVTQWTIRKGLEFSDLMLLKRMSKQKGSNNQKNNGSSGTSFIARYTGGLCFDFNSKDNNIYLVGTEDGQINRCSCSYNEQYLNTYSAHAAPVNKVKWSPFLPGIFGSCSSDWTSKLWNQDSEDEIFKFQSGKDSISDFAWSPHSSTVFATVSSGGKLEIWDLESSVLDPVIIHNVNEGPVNTVSFASHSPIVITGDNTGNISIFKLCKGKNLSTIPNDESTETDNGIISPVIELPLNHVDHQQWRAAEAERLCKIIDSKIKGAVAS